MKKLAVYIETAAGMRIDPIIERALTIADKATTFGNGAAKFVYSSKGISRAHGHVEASWITLKATNLDRVMITAEKLNGIIMGYYGLINAIDQIGDAMSDAIKPKAYFDMYWREEEVIMRVEDYALQIATPPSTEIAIEIDELDFDGIAYNVTDDRFERRDDETDSLTAVDITDNDADSDTDE